MGTDLKGRLKQSVPQTREVNLHGLYLISYGGNRKDAQLFMFYQQSICNIRYLPLT